MHQENCPESLGQAYSSFTLHKLVLSVPSEETVFFIHPPIMISVTAYIFIVDQLYLVDSEIR